MEDAAEATPHRLRTAALANLAAVLERCDEQMVPAVYRFLGAAFEATPTQLGYITLSRALVQALSAPLGGVAGHCLHRGRVVGAGCLLWSACTAGFAGCHSLRAGAAVWGVNGLGLALVLPNTQSLTADLFQSAQRGRAFGMLYLTAALGGMLGALYATNMGAHRPLGIEGWRFAFLSLAAVSAAAGVANLVWAEDPLRQQRQWRRRTACKAVAVLVDGDAPHPGGAERHDGAGGAEPELEMLRQRCGSAASEGRPPPDSPPHASPLPAPARWHGQRGSGSGSPWPERSGGLAGVVAAARPLAADIASVLRIRTFLIIVLQGIMGSIPWSALVFMTLYFQLLGMSDGQASGLVALFLAGTAFGGLLGGCVGDAAAKVAPLHGRIAVTQFSVASGIPFALLVFKGLPRSGSAADVALYAAVLLAFALVKAWPAPACNNPVFAEIVPRHHRNLVYAFDRCFEGAIAACAAPLVGVLAERVFGFSGAGTVTHDRQKDLANASALGNALLAFLVVPWMCCLLLYTGLHWTYPADKVAAARQQRHALRDEAAALEEEGVLIDRLSCATAGSSCSSSGVPSRHSSVGLVAVTHAQPQPWEAGLRQGRGPDGRDGGERGRLLGGDGSG